MDVLLQACDPDGDLIERSTRLAAVPRIGETIAIWGTMYPDHPRADENFFTVLMVTWDDALLAMGNVRIHVSTDGYDIEQVRAIFASEETP